ALAALEQVDGVRAAAHRLDALVLHLQHFAQHLEVVLFVVDDEDPPRLALSPSRLRGLVPGRRREGEGEREGGPFTGATLRLTRSSESRHHPPRDRQAKRG